MSFFSGSPAEYEQFSNLTPQQLRLEKERRQASKGAFGEVRDYYSGNLSDNPADFQAFAAPEMRQFNEQTIPNLAEQFAGMGAGGLSSSGFRNAAIGAGTDLSERLASIRANLRQNAAQGLQGLAQSNLTPHSQYQQTNPGSQGLFGAIGQGLGAAIPGIASGFGQGFGQRFGQSSPYGNQKSGGFGGNNG